MYDYYKFIKVDLHIVIKAKFNLENILLIYN